MTALLLSLAASSVLGPQPVTGQTAAYISLTDGYHASVYCTGIQGADGLAVSAAGDVYVSSETTGRVLLVAGPDSLKTVAEGFDHPEGIAIGSSGEILVVEDAPAGRLVSIDSSGELRVLAEGLSYPEGVAISLDGNPLVTESSAEGSGFPPIFTSLSEVREEGSGTVASALYLWSFSGVAVDSSGAIYVCNETSGMPFVTASVIRIDPDDGTMSVFCRGLMACEGICFSPGGTFPLYVAEEDTGEGFGRVSSVDQSGETAVFASGFGNIEDVFLDALGRMFVSEDTGAGRIYLIAPLSDEPMEREGPDSG